jgi:hypothetical protein
MFHTRLHTETETEIKKLNFYVFKGFGFGGRFNAIHKYNMTE